MISISIIIPTFNHGEFLERALISIKNQTFSDWEAIIIDNNSTDNTNQIINSFRNDGRISTIKINNNGIIAKSRNQGILKSKGKWISFLDSDDIWYPRRLEELMKIAQLEDADIICNDEMRIDLITGTKKALIHGRHSNNFYVDLIRRGNCLSPSGSIVSRKFLSDSNILFSERNDFVTVEDYDFWINLARSGAKFKFLHKILGEYSIHGKNESLRNSLHMTNLNHVLTYHANLYEKSNADADKLRREIQSTKILSNLAINFTKIKTSEILELTLKAFQLSFINSTLFITEKITLHIRSRFTKIYSRDQNNPSIS